MQLNLDGLFWSRNLKKNDGCGKTTDSSAIVEIGFIQGPQKLNGGSGKKINRRMVSSWFLRRVALVA
jgi:hypothetical protein